MWRCALAFFALALFSATFSQAQRSTPIQVLDPSGAANDQFGSVVAIDGDTMIVGASSDDVGANIDQGSAQVYRWTGTGWTFEATLTAAGGAAVDRFGYSVAISGDTVIVSAIFDDIGANANRGSAYIFTRSGTTWTQQAQINASDSQENDEFGHSVAIFGDTVIVGARLHNVGANSDQGAAYIFTRSGSTWTQQAKLVAADGAPTDQFGYSVAIDESGSSVIVGAFVNDVGSIADQGSAYIFVRTGTTWTQQAQLVDIGGGNGDHFGTSVSISGDAAIVGAPYRAVGFNDNQGAAFIFTRSGTTWTQQAQLDAADGAEGDLFGYRVAISRDSALVGAVWDDVGANNNQGSAYVFTRSGTTWTQQAQLSAPDGAALDSFGVHVALSGDTALVGALNDDIGASSNQGSAWAFSRVGSKWIGKDLTFVAADGTTDDEFGSAVSLSGDTAIVGAPTFQTGSNGSAYVFVRTGSSWTQQARLTAFDGAANDDFGSSVAISGDTAIVGAPYDDVGANNGQGSAYVFVRSGMTWTLQAKLTATNGTAGDLFGSSVAISGDTAVAGAYLSDVGVNTDQGSAYVFVRSGTTWTQQAQIVAPDGASEDRFGVGVAVGENNTAIVGAHWDDVGSNTNQGSAYVFVRSGATWTQQAKFIDLGGAESDNFGRSVAIYGDTALIGSNATIGGSSLQGAAYVFTRSGTTWTQQAQLIAADGAASDFFGSSVAVSGDTAIVGASRVVIGANDRQGAAYVFTRAGTTWTQRAKLVASDGTSFDGLGSSVAIDGSTALAGTPLDDIGANHDQGSVGIFDAPANDFVFVRNDVTGVVYTNLSTAVLPSTSGQQITATEAAWRGIGTINTLGRSLALLSSGDLRTPYTSTLEIGGASILAAGDASVLELNGQFRVSSGASADLFADVFTLGSRGTLTARTNSSLTINSPSASLDGQTRIEQGAAVTVLGDWVNIGSVSMSQDSSLTASGSIRNIDEWTTSVGGRVAAGTMIENHSLWTVAAGELLTPLFANRAQANFFGTSAVFGSYSNEFGAITTIRSGTLFVFGSLTNNGTIIGSICSNCLGGPPNMDVANDLNLGPAANLNMPFDGSIVHVGGSFNNAINSNARFDMSLATLQMEGTGAQQMLEVMSKDIGPVALGLDRTVTGHYPMKRLALGPAGSTIRLIDTHDNDGLGQSASEALYVDTLRIDAGSRLMNSTFKIYYNTLINDGTVDVPGNLIQIAPDCLADFNADTVLDFFDYLDFIEIFAAGGPEADFNNDSVIDLFDYLDFVAAFAQGC